MKHDQQLSLALSLMLGLISLFSQPPDSSLSSSTLYLLILVSICTRISPGHYFDDRENVFKSIAAIKENINELINNQVLSKGITMSFSNSIQALVEHDVLAKNIESLTHEYRTKILDWSDFDDSVFCSFDSIKILPCSIYSFKRQRNANNCFALDEVHIPLNVTFPESKMESKMQNLLAQEQYGQKKKPAEEEITVKFPYYAKMCPYPQDRVARVPIIKAIDMINWLGRNFIGTKSPMEYLKEELKSDTITLCKLEQAIPIVTKKTNELLDKLFVEEKNGERISQTKLWLRENQKNVRELILRIHQQLIQELLFNERTLHKDINIIPLYTNTTLHKAVLCISSELVAFSQNMMSFSTDYIHKKLEASYLETWKLIDISLSMLTSMPSPLRSCLRNIEESILRHKVFAEGSDIARHIYNERFISDTVLMVLLVNNIEIG